VFRDEDLRADRQPEFTQVDIEMAFVTQDDVLTSMEEMLRYVFKTTLNIALPAFERMTWRQAMDDFGSDKPDLRAGEPLLHLEHTAGRLSLPILSTEEAAVGVRARALSPTRKVLDHWVDEAKQLGASGLVWIARGTEGLRSNVKALGEMGIAALAEEAGLNEGDALFIIAGPRDKTLATAGQLRLEIARTYSQIGEGWRFLWVTDFPLFEWSEEEGRVVSAHHPFTMPHLDDWAALAENPLTVRSQAYDVVLNGVELASGSVRIHRPDWQRRIFEVLGLSQEEIDSKFGFLVDAFQYGAPPHAGIAFGIDRLVMLMAGAKSLRDVIAFPKTAKGTDPLMDAPSPVEASQLRELGLRLDV
jgi:aspartyl-tRNA synthetase